ncbi:MAG: gluconate 2-dehydrogenase subunit 3 family protein [Pseudomonadota bacterium]
MTTRLLANRREVLASVASIIGAAALPATALAEAPASPIGSFLTDQRFLTAFCDTLIPRGEAGGAVAAKVPQTFIQLMIEWASAERRQRFATVLEELAEALSHSSGKHYAELRPAERLSRLQALDAQAYSSDPPDLASGYRDLKSLLVDIYYLSEVGATRELRYEETPGRWNPREPVTADTKTWVV